MKQLRFELEWSRASDSRFVKYKIQREFGSHFETVIEIGSDSDTVHVIHNLGADILHRFRVVSVYEVRDNIVPVVSNVSSGIIHKFVDSWQTDLNLYQRVLQSDRIRLHMF